MLVNFLVLSVGGSGYYGLGWSGCLNGTISEK